MSFTTSGFDRGELHAYIRAVAPRPARRAHSAKAAAEEVVEECPLTALVVAAAVAPPLAPPLAAPAAARPWVGLGC